MCEISPVKFVKRYLMEILNDYNSHENIKKEWYLELIKKELNE